MSAPEKISARLAALEALNNFSPHRSDYLDDVIEQSSCRAHTTDLVYGVIRNRMLIDELLEQNTAGLLGRTSPALLNILRIGCYELVFVPQSPEYAVVNESAALAGKTASPKQTGFVNAVLRNLTRDIEQRDAPLAGIDPRKTVPVSTQRCCVFKNPFLPDPLSNPADHLARAFSIPGWLINLWLTNFGFEKTKDICFASNRRPSVYLNPNLLAATPQNLLEKLQAEDIEAFLFTTFPCLEMIKVKPHRPITSLPGYLEGHFTIQDPSSAQVAVALDPSSGWAVLDLCAGLGTKTVQLAQLMNNTGQITASDKDLGRLRLLEDGCKRLKVGIVTTIAADKLDQTCGDVRFDAVLADVPCSNTAVLARRPQVRHRLKPAHLESLAILQLELLEKGACFVKPGGKLCYSTCSILDSENIEIVERFLSQNHSFTLRRKTLTLPRSACDDSFDHDGGFFAIFTRE